MTTRREAKQAAAQTSTRWGAIGYHSPVSTAPVSGLRRETGVGKRKGDGELGTYACVRICMRKEAGRKRCAGSKSNARSRGAEPDGRREKVCYGCSIGRRHKHRHCRTQDSICTIYIFCLKCIKYTICCTWPSSQSGYYLSC